MEPLRLSPPSEREPAASVIIATRDRRELVCDVVERLMHQTCPRDRYEVIVACDRCSDGTEAALRDRYGEAVRVVTTMRPGKGGALTEALSVARGRVGIFLDDDVQPAPGLVEAHLRAQERAPAVMGFSPALLPEQPTEYQRRMLRQYLEIFERVEREGRLSSPLDLLGCNYAVDLQTLAEAGGFDEGAALARDDFAVAAALLERGVTFAFSKEARADMPLTTVAVEEAVERAEARALADLHLARKHPWSVRYLPFGAIDSNPAARWRWRVRWGLNALPARLIHLVRRYVPGSRRLMAYEYAFRYGAALERAVPSWSEFRNLVRAQ